MGLTSPARGAAIVALAGLFVAGALLGSGCADKQPPLFSADSAMVHVERQLAFGPRVPGSEARDNATRYIAHTLERCGARVSIQSFDVDDPYSTGRIHLMNVIGSFGIDRSQRLMLASHYDSRPWADQEPDSTRWNTPIPGAVDGALSTAILLELARLVAAQPPSAIGLDLVFFDGEDHGKQSDTDHYLLGSRHFAANLEGYRPVAAILLDMVGGKETHALREGVSNQQTAPLLDYVFGRAKALGLTYFQSEPGPSIYDDHIPLLQAGFDAIDLFGFDYPAWHTLADDISGVDPDKVAQTGALLRDLVYDFRYQKP